MTHAPTAQEKIRGIVRQILGGRLIPFLGAGISMDARSTSDPGRLFHQTAQMATRLREVLASSMRDGTSALPEVHRIRLLSETPVPVGPQPITLAELCEQFLESTGEEDGYRKLVECLEIARFTDLGPTPAHRYIAFLAREGCIEEVITTNYDCALERAYLHTWGRDLPAGREPSGGFVHRIWNLSTYQQLGAPYQATDGHRTARALKVYKLNGCSRALRFESASPKSILLTERQLQDWRERQWAADLVRDRLRTRSLLFCGFGSPEPQIRHTVSRVLEEFSAEAGAPEETDQSPSLIELPNCPFVAYYSRADEPSFHQWQVAVAFRNAHDAKRRQSPLSLLISPDDADQEFRQRKHHGENLPADELWEGLYLEVARSLIDQILGPRSRFAAFLQGLVHCSPALRLSLADLIRRESIWRSLLGWSSEHQTTRLSTWIWRLTGGSGSPPAGWYAPILHYDVLIGQLLLVLNLLDVNLEAEDSVRLTDYGLRMTWHDGEERVVYIAGSGQSLPSRGMLPHRGLHRLRAQLVLDSPSAREEEGSFRTWVSVRLEEGEELLEQLTIARLRLSRVLSRPTEAPGMDVLKLRLKRALLFPTAEARSAAPGPWRAQALAQRS